MRKSNLVRHAEDELKRAGLFDKGSDYGGMLGRSALEIVRMFAKQGHSGFSASLSIDLLTKLLRYEPLTPLTFEPDEWIDVSEFSGRPMWQNRRKHSVFSTDAGKSHYDIDEPEAA